MSNDLAVEESLLRGLSSGHVWKVRRTIYFDDGMPVGMWGYDNVRHVWRQCLRCDAQAADDRWSKTVARYWNEDVPCIPKKTTK